MYQPLLDIYDRPHHGRPTPRRQTDRQTDGHPRRGGGAFSHKKYSHCRIITMARRSKPGKRSTGRPRRRYGRRAAKRGDGGKVVALRNTLVPDRLITKFSYKDNVNLTDVLSFGTKIFRLNSIYDPDLDLVNGHQPLGYDQWSTFYNKYRVYKAVVRATIMNNQNGGIQCAIVPFNSNQPIDLNDSLFEQPHAVSKTAAATGGMGKVVLTKVVDIPRIVGQSHAQYKANEQAASDYNSNPLEQIYCMIAARAVNDSTGVSAIAVVDITYYVELYDRKRQSLSYPEGKDPDAEFKSGFSPSFAVDDNAIQTIRKD